MLARPIETTSPGPGGAGHDLVALPSFGEGAPDHELVAIVCEGQVTDVRPLRKPRPRPAGPPSDALIRIVKEVPMPTVAIGAAPRFEGIFGVVNMESSFWIEGWDGSPITYTTGTPWGTTIELEATPDRFEWDFGDGTVVATRSLGSPSPMRSDITHNYWQASEDYRVGVRFVFKARWRENGGPWRDDVPGIERTASIPYPVREVRTVLTHGA